MHPLDSLFPSPAVADVLRFLLEHPTEAFYQRMIAEKTGYALFQVQKALERIEEAGLIRKYRDGKKLYYRPVMEHPAFLGLRDAFLMSV